MMVSATQPIESLGATESEFYAQVRAAVEGLFLKNVLEFYDHHVTLELCSDNSAARSVLGRLGAGKKTRHIAIKFSWIQRYVRERILKVLPTAGVDNESDIGTKYLSYDKIVKILTNIGMFVMPLEAEGHEIQNGGGSGMEQSGVMNTLRRVTRRYTGVWSGVENLMVGFIIVFCLIGVVAAFAAGIWCGRKIYEKKDSPQQAAMAPVAGQQSAAQGSTGQTGLQPLMSRLRLDDVVQAPSRGKIHVTMKCRHLKHLKDDRAVHLEWCSD